MKRLGILVFLLTLVQAGYAYPFNLSLPDLPRFCVAVEMAVGHVFGPCPYTFTTAVPSSSPHAWHVVFDSTAEGVQYLQNEPQFRWEVAAVIFSRLDGEYDGYRANRYVFYSILDYDGYEPGFNKYIDGSYRLRSYGKLRAEFWVINHVDTQVPLYYVLYFPPPESAAEKQRIKLELCSVNGACERYLLDVSEVMLVYDARTGALTGAGTAHLYDETGTQLLAEWNAQEVNNAILLLQLLL